MSKNIIPAALLFSLAFSAPVGAKGWTLYKFAEISLSGTDNFQLSDTDSKELVGSVKPSIELSFDGNRFNTNIAAELEAYRFNEISYNVNDPRLAINITGTLLENLIYMNTSLEIGKIFPGEDFYSLYQVDDAGVRVDPETKGRFRFNPFLAKSFGRVADVYFGYGHQSIDNEVDAEIDTQQDTLSFSVGRNPKYGGYLWKLGGSYEKDRTRGSTTIFENGSVYGSLGSTVGQSVYFEVRAGAETNEFNESVENLARNTSMWETTLNWTPSERTRLKVGYGERFFGHGPTFSFKHRVENAEFIASWTRGISTSANSALGTVEAFEEADDNPVAPTNGLDAFDENGVLTNIPFVDRSLRLGYKAIGRRSDLIIDAVYSNQDSLVSEAEKQSILGRVVFDRHLSPLTTIRFQYDHKIQIEDSATVNTDSSENRLSFKFIYNFDRKERTAIIESSDNSE